MNINDLHQAASGGDSGAKTKLFEKLLDNFSLFVQQRVWNKEDSEEIVQDTMTTIAQKYGELDVHTSFAAWAHQVYENKVLHYYRSKKYHKDRYSEMPPGELSVASDAVDHRLVTSLIACLKKIAGTNLRHARILNFAHQGYKMDEICLRLDLTVSNCYKLLSRARSELRSCLDGD